jgi:hypothetical protein
MENETIPQPGQVVVAMLDTDQTRLIVLRKETMLVCRREDRATDEDIMLFAHEVEIVGEVEITHPCEYTEDGGTQAPRCGRPAVIQNPHGITGSGETWFDHDEWFCAKHADPEWLADQFDRAVQP